jgi:DNA-directed RNA polymerase subunit RPC12/RpoP
MTTRSFMHPMILCPVAVGIALIAISLFINSTLLAMSIAILLGAVAFSALPDSWFKMEWQNACQHCGSRWTDVHFRSTFPDFFPETRIQRATRVFRCRHCGQDTERPR